jgi:aerobic C4-dicarboxylate transport protein
MQVLVAVAMGILISWVSPTYGEALKPLGDGFIAVKMMIAPIIFCTVVHGVASMSDMKKLGRVGVKTLLYFEVVSTLALVIGLVVVNLLKPGAGFDIDPTTLDPAIGKGYAQKAHELGIVPFLLNVIPTTLFDAFVTGDLLQVLLVSLLAAFAILLGPKRQPVLAAVESASDFSVSAIAVKLAPLGALGAMVHGG